MEDNVSQHRTMQNYKFHGGTVDNMINFELADRAYDDNSLSLGNNST